MRMSETSGSPGHFDVSTFKMGLLVDEELIFKVDHFNPVEMGEKRIFDVQFFCSWILTHCVINSLFLHLSWV